MYGVNYGIGTKMPRHWQPVMDFVSWLAGVTFYEATGTPKWRGDLLMANT